MRAIAAFTLLALLAAGRAAAEPDDEIAWYRPGPRDRRIAWNTHDPWTSWGSSRRLALAIGYDGFLGLDNPAPGEESAGELGLRLDGRTAGLYAGLFPDGLYAVGLSLLRHRGWLLWDLGLPDVGLGLLYPSIDLRLLTDGEVFVANAALSPTGVRLVWADSLVVDGRVLLPGVWYEVDAETFTWSWGLAVDLGVTF